MPYFYHYTSEEGYAALTANAAALNTSGVPRGQLGQPIDVAGEKIAGRACELSPSGKTVRKPISHSGVSARPREAGSGAPGEGTTKSSTSIFVRGDNMKSDKELAKVYAEIVKEKLQAYNTNRPPNWVAATEKWNVSAQAQIGGAFGLAVLCTCYRPWNEPPIPKDKIFTYSGVGGGAFIGGGPSAGGFWCFVDHPQLAGDSGFSVEMVTGGYSIQFYRDGLGLIAHYVGGGVVVGVGGGGGTGHFRLSQSFYPLQADSSAER